MPYSTGRLLFIFMLAVLLSWLAAWLVARRFRAAMRWQMSAPLPVAQAPADAAAGTLPAPVAPPSGEPAPSAPWPVSPAANRRAGWRLAGLLVGLSALVSFSSALLMVQVVMPDLAWSWRRLIVLGLVQMWPVVPSLALLWRWSGWRLLAGLGLWCVAGWALVVSQSHEARPAQALLYLASEVGPPMLLAAAVCLGGATRAVAPWVLLPMIGLVWASQMGLDLGAVWANRPPAAFETLVRTLGVWATLALLSLLPWLLAWWPVKCLGRLLAQAYARKTLSELMVLFTAVWGIALLVRALGAASDLGLGGAVMLLPLAWIPVVMPVWRRWHVTAAGRPPTLLVLRVFQHDARIQALFDHVIEHWRLTGNTVLIAGTDLVERTLSADDIFSFIDGTLGSRFIRTPAEVPQRLAEFDLRPDAEGRYRVNECYCHDSTWQLALAALVRRSDTVLMDLRSFRSHNQGCLHELQVLSAAQGLARVVVLTDGDTDVAAAQAATAQAPSGRFAWIDSARIHGARRREVLDQLFIVPDAGAPPRRAEPQAT